MRQLKERYRSSYQDVRNALEARYEDDSSGIYRYLFDQLPPLGTPRTLNELDVLVERFAHWVEGYRIAYWSETIDTHTDQAALEERTALIEILDDDTDKMNKEINNATFNEEKKEVIPTMEVMDTIAKETVNLIEDAHNNAVEVFKSLEQAGQLKNVSWEESWILSMYDSSHGGVEVGKYSQRQELRRKWYRSPPQTLPIESGDLSEPESNFTLYLTPYPMAHQQGSLRQRIEKNLSYIKGGGPLVHAVDNYRSLGRPDIIRANAANAKRDLDLATSQNIAFRNHLMNLSKDLNDIRERGASLRARLKVARADGLKAAARAALWRNLWRAIKELMIRSSQSPTMMKRYLDVQELVVNFEKQDLDYLPQVADVLVHGSPKDVENLEIDVNKTMCEFAVKTEITILPLPRTLEKLAGLIKPCS